MRKKTIDKKDIQILNLISKDSSLTGYELAEKAGLTPGPLTGRMQQFKKNGILKGYRAVLDYGVLGYVHTRLVILCVPTGRVHMAEELGEIEPLVTHLWVSRKEEVSWVLFVVQGKTLQDLDKAEATVIGAENPLLRYRFDSPECVVDKGVGLGERDIR